MPLPCMEFGPSSTSEEICSGDYCASLCEAVISQKEDPGRDGKNLVQSVLTSVESLKPHWHLD